MSCQRPYKFPYSITPLDGKQKLLLEEIFPGESENFLQVGPHKYIIGKSFQEHHERLYNFKARPSDVWLYGFPRSGTTLTQEMVWLIGNDLDYEGAAKEVMDHRFPVLDRVLFFSGDSLLKPEQASKLDEDVKNILQKYNQDLLKTLDTMTKRRFVKVHLPISLGPPNVFDVGCKVIFCARHPKDVIVSNFHIYRLFKLDHNQDIKFPTFWKLIKNNLIHNTPYFENLKEGWARRNDKNFLFLFYEDTNKDKRKALKKIAEFLEKELTYEEVEKLADHLGIDKFRQNKSVNNDHMIKVGFATGSKEDQFIRKGEVGGWKKYFVDGLEEEVDQWIKENLKGSDLVLPQV